MSDPASASIGRISLVQPGEGLQATSVLRAVESDVTSGKVLQDLNLAWVLADATESNAGAFVDVEVGHVDVCGVLLRSDGVVAAFVGPVEVGDCRRKTEFSTCPALCLFKYSLLLA